LLASFLNNEGKLLPKEKRCIYLEYSEESIAERKERDKGNIDVMEYMWQVSGGILSHDDRKRKHYPQSIRSNKVGPIVLPDLDTLWSLNFGQKKALYGTGGRIAVGGPADKEEEEIDAKHKVVHRINTTVEPVAFMDMSVEFYEDMYDAYHAKTVINLTSAGLNAAVAAIRMKIPYIGIVWTEAHSDFYQAALIQRVFTSMQEENNPLYEPELATLLGNKPKAKANPTPGDPKLKDDKKDPKKKAKADPKAKAKADPKAKGKPKATAKLSKAQMLKQLSDMGEEGEEENFDEEEEEEDSDDEEEVAE
jgi:hypothetical protein